LVENDRLFTLQDEAKTAKKVNIEDGLLHGSLAGEKAHKLATLLQLRC
jgi:hypothetical protein